MAISFNQIPNNLLVPFVAAEFDSSRAQQGPALLAYRGLIIGQKTAAGTAVANSLHRVSNADQVATLAGRGSLLHRQAIAWFKNNSFTETWIGVLEDAGAAVAATGTLTFTGPAGAAGTINLYIGGELVQVPVATGATAAQIGPLVAAAITAAADLPVTAAAGAAGSEHIVTVTARNKGECGNGIDLRVNYQYGETLPAGVGVAIVAMDDGATNPTLTTLVAAMGDMWFHIIAHPYTDATSLTAIETELASRSGPLRMIDGVAFTAANCSHGDLGTLGRGRNSQFTCIVADPSDKPVTPPYERAAATAAVVAYHGPIDPARPFQTLPIAGVKAPAEQDLFTLAQRNQLLHDGIATTRVGPGGVVQIERTVTTYKQNAAGSPDTAYRDVNTMLTLMYLRYAWRVRMATKYPRHKLADDGTRIGAGQAVMTPKLGKAEAVGWFGEMEELGLVEGFAQFKRDLVVERNAADPNRLDVLLPPDLINQLVVTAAKFQFLL